MTIHVICEECGQPNEVADQFAGGIVNCSGCGRAVSVPGLRDPLWRALQVVAAVVWAAATAIAYASAGLLWAMVVAAIVAALVWLVSRAF